jgi:hypothetical protein
MIYRRDRSRVVEVRREVFDGEVANEHVDCCVTRKKVET